MSSRLISPEYAEMNRQLHADHGDYGVGSSTDAEQIAAFCREHGLASILDFGCGKGALKIALQRVAPNLQVWEFDPAVPGKQNLPAVPVDFVVALDVMEHIEPDYLESVLSTLRDLKSRFVLLVIALEPAKKLLADGRNAHLIVQPAAWWAERLGRHFVEAAHIDTPGHYTFIGVPR